jgi:hypothetical protein
LGKQIKYGPIDGDAPWRTVVGVAGDVEENGDIEETWVPALYPAPVGEMSLVARTSVEPQSLIETVRQQVWEVDPNQPVYGVTTLEDMVAELSAPQRFHTVLFILFADWASSWRRRHLWVDVLLGPSELPRDRECGWRSVPVRDRCAGWSCAAG